jgi:hypothetical protein
MCLRISYKKKYENNFFCILEVAEERSRIRSRIRQSEVQNPGFGSAPKCHRFPTLLERCIFVNVSCSHILKRKGNFEETE